MTEVIGRKHNGYSDVTQVHLYDHNQSMTIPSAVVVRI